MPPSVTKPASNAGALPAASSDAVTLQAPVFGKQLERLPRTSGVIYRLNPIAQSKNACGTTSLAMIFNAFGVQATADELDAKYRKYVKVGTSVYSMVEATRDYGLYGEVYNRSNFEEIREHLENKHLLVVASLDTNTKKYGISSHYVVIRGYAIMGGEPYVAITDPGGGRHYWKKYEDLEADWIDPRYAGLNLGYSNTLIAISKHDDLPPSRIDPLLRAGDRVGYAGNQLTNAYVDLKKKNFREAARQTGKGLAIGVPSLFGFVRHSLLPGKKKP